MTPRTPHSLCAARPTRPGDLDATTGTTLFDMTSSATGSAIQSPANGGSTAAIDDLGVDFRVNTGFDVWRFRSSKSWW